MEGSGFFIWLFVLSAGLVFYTYIVFPALLGFLAVKFRRDADTSKDNHPLGGVSVLISAYNEEDVIERKLASVISTGFPAEKLEVIVGSDSSEDNTGAIVRAFSERHPNVKLHEFSARRGKPSVINDLVSIASHPLIILTDANVIFDRDVIVRLMRHFRSAETGLVGANILNSGLRRDGISMQEKSYIERENLIKYREGLLWGTMMGPFGGCYMMRKELYERVPAEFLVDDFFIAMHVIDKGKRCLNDLDALCFEDVSNDLWQEYRRKSRISAGNFQNLKKFGRLLLKPYTAAGFCFLSHKVLRWFTPFLIILSLVALIFLSMSSDFFLLLLLAEVFLLLSPVLDRAACAMGIHIRLLRFISYFTMMNLALLRGFFRYMKGIDSGVWSPTKRR